MTPECSERCDQPGDHVVISLNGWIYDACWAHALVVVDPIHPQAVPGATT